jgi:hypothetical protein
MRRRASIRNSSRRCNANAAVIAAIIILFSRIVGFVVINIARSIVMATRGAALVSSSAVCKTMHIVNHATLIAAFIVLVIAAITVVLIIRGTPQEFGDRGTVTALRE